MESHWWEESIFWIWDVHVNVKALNGKQGFERSFRGEEWEGKDGTAFMHIEVS